MGNFRILDIGLMFNRYFQRTSINISEKGKNSPPIPNENAWIISGDFLSPKDGSINFKWINM
jgi:hypothetical protein